MFLSVFLFGQNDETKQYRIKDAIEKKLITYSLNGAWNSDESYDYTDANGQYYGKCMSIKMRNIVDTPLYIYFDNGLMLLSEDSSTQDMIITEPLWVKLEKRQSKSVKLYAMCGEIHDGVPHLDKKYKIGNFADVNLVAITNSISEMFMQNIVGQSAVWAYTDDASEEDVRYYGANDATLKLTAQILNNAHVTTKLNPQNETEKKEDELIVRHSEPVVVSSKLSRNGTYIPAYLYYGGMGLIVVLTFTTFYYANRNKKGKDKNGRLS